MVVGMGWRERKRRRKLRATVVVRVMARGGRKTEIGREIEKRAKSIREIKKREEREEICLKQRDIAARKEKRLLRKKLSLNISEISSQRKYWESLQTQASFTSTLNGKETELNQGW